MIKIATMSILLLLIGKAYCLQAQEDLLGILEEMETEEVEYIQGTFKSVRIVNGHTVEMPGEGALQFVISHRFGRINEGGSELFGLDQANIRLGLEYGITPWLEVGVGRSNVLKTYDGFAKIRLLRQSSGVKNMPVSMAWVSSVMVNTLPWREPERDNLFSSRLSFNHQLLIARKFSSAFSVQIMPTLIHRNLVEQTIEPNDVIALGIGVRQLISPSVSINIEYYHLFTDYVADNFEQSLSVGIDIETGGHVFQLFLTNSRGMTENLFVAETTGAWSEGDIHFGFNVNRIFQLKARK